MSKDLKQLHKATEALYLAEAQLKSAISEQGEKIAKDQDYKNLNGLEAVHRYLIDRYHWLPDQVRSLSVDDLNLLLEGYDGKKVT